MESPQEALKRDDGILAAFEIPLAIAKSPLPLNGSNNLDCWLMLGRHSGSGAKIKGDERHFEALPEPPKRNA
jgi:hypothetical protein